MVDLASRSILARHCRSLRRVDVDIISSIYLPASVLCDTRNLLEITLLDSSNIKQDVLNLPLDNPASCIFL